MAYTFNWESRNSVWIKFSGVVRYVDVIKATEALYNDARIDFVRFVFWDFSAIDSLVVTESEVDEIAAMDFAAGLYMRPMKQALIARDPMLIELCQKYIDTLRNFGSPWLNKIFGSAAEAQQWADAK